MGGGKTAKKREGNGIDEISAEVWRRRNLGIDVRIVIDFKREKVEWRNGQREWWFR